MNINFVTGIAYDSEDNVIDVPDGYAKVSEDCKCGLVKVSENEATFVYRPPNINSEKYKLAQKLVGNEE